jgi:cytosine/adenosine deaminase-related metal-dependent hydrolase/ubiquinone/menaquinone biosynthesis C-methylase UbiE
MSDLTKSINSSPGGRLRNDRAFAVWAQSYDTQLNPLLMLEERYLKGMLPEVRGRNVLDAGCGSGRWLPYLAGREPRRLCGIDASAEMIEVASRKSISGVELYQGRCDLTPFAENSFDLIISSFVLGYIEDIYSLASEADRIARDECDLFLSDMHPETQGHLGWKRAFQGTQGEIVLDAVTRSLTEIVRIFHALGWELGAAIEPEFGAKEREAFVTSGRMDQFLEAENHPAIYLLHLQKKKTADRQSKQGNATLACGGRCTLGARENAFASIRIAGGRISHIASEPLISATAAACDSKIDLTGYLLLPGLINAHDHLEFALFPRMGNPPYENASDWSRDIQGSFADVIAQHRAVPRYARLWWGGLRNLLCGVTTVCHHNPLEPELQRENFPVRVVQKYGWEHSLAFGSDLLAAHSATPEESAFIVHACEGVDEASRAELWHLDRLGVLDKSAVIVHGLAMDEEGATLMRQRQASLVICPSSNHFLFGKVPDMNLLGSIRKVALGSDSPLTAEGDLLDEIRFATRFCGIPPRYAYRMVTESAAAILRLGNGEGFIRVGAAGDLIAVPDRQQDAADLLQTLSLKDVELVMIGGRVQLASEAVFDRLPLSAKEGLEPLWVDGMVRWLRAPVKELLGEAENVLGKGALRLGGKPIRDPQSAEAGYAC